MKRRQKLSALFLAGVMAVSPSAPVLAGNMENEATAGYGTAAEAQDMKENGIEEAGAEEFTTEEVSAEEVITEDMTEDQEDLLETMSEGTASVSEDSAGPGTEVEFRVEKESDSDSRLLFVRLEWPKEGESYLWNADTHQWENIPFGESGAYVLGQSPEGTPLSWNLEVSGNSAVGIPGYRWNDESQAYEYYLDAEEAAELEGTLGDVPLDIYVGAKGDISGHDGLQTIDGKTYYLNEDGSLLKNGKVSQGDTVYCFDGKGQLEKSYKPVEPGWVQRSGKYYWRLEDGTYFKEGGWQTLGGKRYFLDQKSGFRRTGWLTYNKKQYYLNPSTGIMVKGAVKLKGKIYVLASNGVKVKKGWATIGPNTYYVLPKTGCAATGWKTLKGKKYYFIPSAKGKRAEGWRKIGGSKYYFVKNTGVMKKGILKLSGKQYYFGKNGKLVVSKKFYVIGKKSYKINKKGELTVLKDTKAQILAKKRLNKIGWDLKKAFQWSAGMRYVDNDNTPGPGETFGEHNAIYGFKNHAGDCHVMAASFYYMAQALGYDARLIKGSVPLASGGMGSHGWCEITMNGRSYIFDPDFTNQTGRNGYKITYGTSGTWMYTDGQTIR